MQLYLLLVFISNNSLPCINSYYQILEKSYMINEKIPWPTALLGSFQLFENLWSQYLTEYSKMSPLMTHTHFLHFNGHFPGEPGLAGLIGAKDNGSGG